MVPIAKRYNAITGGGHNNLFQDKDGNWWATMFFNPRGAQAAEYKSDVPSRINSDDL